MNNTLITLIISVLTFSLIHTTKMESNNTESFIVLQNTKHISLYQANNIIIYNMPSSSNDKPHSSDKEPTIQNEPLGVAIGTWLAKSIASTMGYSTLALLSTATGILTAQTAQKAATWTLENASNVITITLALIHNM